MMKYCNRCKSMLAIELFTLRNKGGKMRSAYCKPCKNTITREWCRRKAQERMTELPPRFKGMDLVAMCIARWFA
jgi:hypothetical protein